MRRLTRPLLLLGGLAALAPAAAAAAPPAPPTGKIAVFSIDGFGLAKKVALAPVKLTTLLGAVLAAQGLEVVTPPLGPSDLSMALDCGVLDAGCHAKIGTYLGVDGLVLGELRAVKGKVRAKLTLWSSGHGVVAREVAEVLVLTPATVDAELERLARTLEGVVPPPPAPVVEPPLVVAEVVPPPPEVPPSAPPPPPGFRLSVPGVVVAGTGLLLVAGSVAAGFNTARLNRMYEAAPSENFDDLHALQDIERRGRTSATITLVALGVGGAALAAGVVLVVLRVGAGGGDERGARAPAAALSAGLLPGGGIGASLRVPFLEPR